MKFNFQTGLRLPAVVHKLLLVMKLTLIFLITIFLQISHASYGQRVTYKGKNITVEKFFQVIQAQTPYKVLYAEEMVNGLDNVSLNLKNVSVEDALNACLDNKPLTYTIDKNVIVIKFKP
jgi:hypothetical protein